MNANESFLHACVKPRHKGETCCHKDLLLTRFHNNLPVLPHGKHCFHSSKIYSTSRQKYILVWQNWETLGNMCLLQMFLAKYNFLVLPMLENATVPKSFLMLTQFPRLLVL